MPPRPIALWYEGMKSLSKILFPHHNANVRRKEMRFLALALLLALLLCGLIALALYLMNISGRI